MRGATHVVRSTLIAACVACTSLEGLSGDGGAPADGGASDGGGGASSPTPVAAADYAIAVTPPSVSLAVGQSASVTVTAARIGAFASPIDVTVDGLPSGVTATPLSLAVSSGTFMLAAAANAPAGHVKLTVKGAAAGELSTAPLDLNVSGTAVFDA